MYTWVQYQDPPLTAARKCVRLSETLDIDCSRYPLHLRPPSPSPPPQPSGPSCSVSTLLSSIDLRNIRSLSFAQCRERDRLLFIRSDWRQDLRKQARVYVCRLRSVLVSRADGCCVRSSNTGFRYIYVICWF